MVFLDPLDNPATKAVESVRMERQYANPVVNVRYLEKRNHEDRIVIVRQNAYPIELFDCDGEIGLETSSPSFRITKKFFDVMQQSIDSFVI